MKAFSYLILGSGHFGRLAAERLLQENPHSDILVVDRQAKLLEAFNSLPVQLSLGDGVSELDRLLKTGHSFDYLIPAVPFHVAFEYLLHNLKPLGAKRGSVPPFSGLPNALMGENGDLYTSLADFLCPEDCSEPPLYCTVTGKRREKPLYQILTDIFRSYESRVIQSQQLAPSVGGFPLRKLGDLLEDLRVLAMLGQPILISTACLCHGVTSAFSFSVSR
jgi:hypothetical protein